MVKPVKSALEKVQDHEASIQAMAGMLEQMANAVNFANQQVAQAQAQTNYLNQVVTALVQLVGQEKVEVAIFTAQKQKAAEEMQRAIDGGVVIATESVTADSVLDITTEQGREFASFSAIPAFAQEKILGKTVGDTVSISDDLSMTIHAVYRKASDVQREVHHPG